MSAISGRIVSIALGIANGLVPKRPFLLLHSYPDLDDQVIGILTSDPAKLQKFEKIIVLLDGDRLAAEKFLNKRLVFEIRGRTETFKKNSLRGLWSYCRSQYVLFTHGIFGAQESRFGQTRVNLWHGMPLKKIWNNAKDSPPPPCDMLLSTSPFFSSILSNAGAIEKRKIRELGLPRNDLLFRECREAVYLVSELRKEAKKLLLFLPTYRHPKRGKGYQHNDGLEFDDAIGIDGENLSRLKALLEQKEARMLVKPHPMSIHYRPQAYSDGPITYISNEWLRDKGVSLYELLGNMDAFVTDISSVYVDVLCIRIPVIFYFPDFEEYKNTRGFELDPIEKWLAGPLCLTASELIKSVENALVGTDKFLDRRAEVRETLNPQSAPDASLRLIEALLDE